MTAGDLQRRLREIGLRITPQRITVLDVLLKSNHPTAELIATKVRETHPNIATGTIYKILETFVDKEIIRKMETSSDVMRYDAILESHHHLQSENGERLEDYFDDGLSQLVKDYLNKKEITDFELTDIKIQIIGKFNNNKTN